MASVAPEAYQSYFDQWEQKIGAFIEYRSGGVPKQEAGAGHTSAEPQAALTGLPFAVKDNIAVRGFSLTCGSKLLKHLRAPYTATAARRLEKAGAVAVGKTNLDEFGMGSSTGTSALGRTNNPWDIDRVPGGSSGGSAAAVAAGLVPFALGTDTGGSVRQPASFCGVVGLKPTYGAVSRYGLVAYASSLETIGVLADTVARCRRVFEAIQGQDPLDQTSRPAPPRPALAAGPSRVIGILSAETIARSLAEAAGEHAGDSAAAAAAREAAAAAEPETAVARSFALAKERLAALGHTLIDVAIPSLKYGVPAYYTIAAAEASANLARFDGVRYGARPDWAENPEDLINKTREAGLGDEVKLRILLGTFVLRSGFQDRYYLRAQRIRQGIRRQCMDVLERCDAVLMPVFPTLAFGRGESGLSPFAQRAADLYTCCANLAGLPALAFPTGLEGGLPTGVQLLGREFGEMGLLDLAEAYEAAHPFPHPAGYQAFWR